MIAKTIAIIILVGISHPAFAWMDPNASDVDIRLNTEDNQFAFYNGPSGQSEWLLNNGARTTIRLKGYDDLSAMKWDLSAYAGETIEAVELHLCKADDDAINALVVSTINSDWTEGARSGSQASNGEPCWRWRSYPEGEWTYTGSDFSTASFGNFGTLVCFGYKHNDTFRQYHSDGRDWIAMKLDPAIIYAMIQDNFGIVVTDPRFGSQNGNPRIYSSEQGASVQPRLYIKVASTSDVNPAGNVTNLAALPGDWNGEVVLQFTAPADPDDDNAFGYTVRYAMHDDFATATDVARWRIPRPGEPGTTDKLLIEDLEPSSTYNFWVQAYDKVGNAGSAMTTRLTLPTAMPVPALTDGQLPTPDATGRQILGVPGVLNYWACSELAKVNPETGNRLEDGYTGSGDDDYKKANVVWDSAANTITLRPVRNQVVGFQLIVQRLLASLTGVAITIGDLSGPGGTTIDATDNIELFKLHYVGSGTRYADPAIPLSAPFADTLEIPSSNNPGGTYQSIWCDIYIPRAATPGTYTGAVTIDSNELSSPVTVNLEVIVATPVIPDKPTFSLDLNGYGNKWNSTASRYQVFQICHKHRMVPNTLPYGWSERWSEDRTPELTGSGPNRQISSWTTFTTNYGPFFDGSAFSPTHPTYPYHGPGQNTPIANFYTTGFEGWPVSISDSTYGYDADGLGHAYWNSQVDTGADGLQNFWLEAPDVMTAFPAGFAEGTRNVWQQFAQYAQDNNWTTATGLDQGEDAALSILLSGENVPGYGAFDGRIGTIRMKAMRYGQQLCEMLNLLSGASGWNRNLTARALSVAHGDHAGPGYDAFGGDVYTDMRILDYYKLHAELTATLVASACNTDSDGDGVLDCNDGCYLDPDKTEPGVCGCGTADTDSDMDGIPDCNDASPDQDSGDGSGGGCFIQVLGIPSMSIPYRNSTGD